MNVPKCKHAVCPKPLSTTFPSLLWFSVLVNGCNPISGNLSPFGFFSHPDGPLPTFSWFQLPWSPSVSFTFSCQTPHPNSHGPSTPEVCTISPYDWPIFPAATLALGLALLSLQSSPLKHKWDNVLMNSLWTRHTEVKSLPKLCESELKSRVWIKNPDS